VCDTFGRDKDRKASLLFHFKKRDVVEAPDKTV